MRREDPRHTCTGESVFQLAWERQGRKCWETEVWASLLCLPALDKADEEMRHPLPSQTNPGHWFKSGTRHTLEMPEGLNLLSRQRDFFHDQDPDQQDKLFPCVCAIWRGQFLYKGSSWHWATLIQSASGRTPTAERTASSSFHNTVPEQTDVLICHL